MGMAHEVQDGRDAAARARSSKQSRPRPIRYDQDTWLVMRNDPVLPAAVILRLRGPGRQEFFVTVRWDLEPENRRMIGRYPTLQEADDVVLYETLTPVVGAPLEDNEQLRRRQEQHAVELERQQAERAKRYGP
jgi:hypothetical protein